jgi:hypothetical protein
MEGNFGFRRALVAVGAAVGLIGMTACGAAASMGNPNTLQGAFVATGTGYAYLLQVTTGSGGGVTGSVQTATLSADGLSVAATTNALTGTTSDSLITLTLGGEPVTGSSASGGVTLNFPQTDGSVSQVLFTPSSVVAYNAAVSILQGDASEASATAAESSANAAAASEAAAAAAAAASSAAAASAAQTLADTETASCEHIGGHIGGTRSTDDLDGNCVSNTIGDPSGQPGADCENTEIDFNSDGSIDQDTLVVVNDNYPECFK